MDAVSGPARLGAVPPWRADATVKATARIVVSTERVTPVRHPAQHTCTRQPPVTRPDEATHPSDPALRHASHTPEGAAASNRTSERNCQCVL